jgi:hypothetical protein
MCTYLTLTTDVAGSGRAGDDWFRVERAVVYFDHPQDAPLDHALCIDVSAGDPAQRVSVELDAASARRLAETILATLDDPEVQTLTCPT